MTTPPVTELLVTATDAPPGTYQKPRHFGRIQITKLVDGAKRVYLDRTYVFRCKWFSVRIHRILLPDMDPDPHDHPWSFVSVPIHGAYTEHWGPEGRRRLTHSRLVRLCSFHRASDLHRITELHPAPGRPVTTLVITGPECRSWGFHTPHGWVARDDYFSDATPSGEPR